jgi:acyl dehydratase
MPDRVLYYDDLQVGDEFTTAARTITAEDVERFAHLSGDLNPIHLDDEAARHGPFGKRVVHGAMIVAVASGLMSPMLIPSTLAAHGLDKVRFRRPVFLGDTIHVVMRVASLRALSDQSAILRLRCRVIRNNAEAAMVGIFSVIMNRRARPA